MAGVQTRKDGKNLDCVFIGILLVSWLVGLLTFVLFETGSQDAVEFTILGRPTLNLCSDYLPFSRCWDYCPLHFPHIYSAG